MKKIILIKLGGSLISDKTKVNVARLKEIDQLSRQIKNILDQNNNLSFILATGAGGFGHPLAEKYKNNLEKGWPYIRAAIKKLNQIVVSSLIQYHVPAISVNPFLISQPEIGKIINLLKAGKIPVFHADLIKDKQSKISILSMDKFLVDLAIFLKEKGFKIEKIVFCGVTNGVINDKKKTIRIINKKNIIRLEKYFFKNKTIDVSGGMRGKVKESLRLINKIITGLIINGQKTNSLRDAVADNKIEGTIISG
jgi:isopentenyl phosphate kinase